MKLFPTASQTAGPFLHLGLTDKGSVGQIASETAPGQRVRITCCVLDGDGVPVTDAMVEVWQADARGRYRHPEDRGVEVADRSWRGFGRLALNQQGMCTFDTVKPGVVPGPGKTRQAPHISLAIFARGLLKQLRTRIYFAGEVANQEDPVLSLVPDQRKQTLLADPDLSLAGAWRFTIRLGGDEETVFFDV